LLVYVIPLLWRKAVYFGANTTYTLLVAIVEVAFRLCCQANFGGVCTQEVGTPRPEREHAYDRLLIESVDETLTAVLSEIVREAVHDALGNKFHITMDQVPDRLDEFWLDLEKLLGAVPSSTIGKVIIKSFYAKLGLELVSRANWRLPDYVREARTKMSGRSESVE
jgi:hypothetical protein